MGAPLFDTTVLIERIRAGATGLSGSTTVLNLIEFPKAAHLKGLDIISPGKDDYDKGFELSVLLLKAGTPIPAVDVVLAAVAMNRGLVLHTRDRHFDYVSRVNKDFQVHIE
ncbi:MAG: PIN domain-containing protein [Candidatus Thorarchaeota archaeon]|nr:PIN domain-containing protein [Candidatus Thorarchaeota archaeon]